MHGLMTAQQPRSRTLALEFRCGPREFQALQKDIAEELLIQSVSEGLVEDNNLEVVRMVDRPTGFSIRFY